MTEELIIEPGRTERHYWRDLWRYRELFRVLAWRDIAVRYKQTVIGVAWAVIRPFLTMVIFTSTLTLQEFVYALTFVSASDQKPITLGVATDLIRGDVFYWGDIMAGALIASIPVVIAYNLFLDRFISGITGGAVK